MCMSVFFSVFMCLFLYLCLCGLCVHECVFISARACVCVCVCVCLLACE